MRRRYTFQVAQIAESGPTGIQMSDVSLIAIGHKSTAAPQTATQAVGVDPIAAGNFSISCLPSNTTDLISQPNLRPNRETRKFRQN